MTNSARQITAESNSYVGEQACLTGTTTGTSCGFVTAAGTESVSGVFSGRQAVVNHLSRVAPVCNGQGNSDGPVFSGNTALGLTSFTDSSLPQCKNYDLYSEITEDADYLGVTVAPRVVSSPPPKPRYADELGFVRFSKAPANTHLDTYIAGPTYKTLASNSDVGYPAVTDPENIQALALNTDTGPYQAPGTWGYDNLGGTLTSDPDISSWGGGRLDVFAKSSTSGTLNHRAFSSTAWFPWDTLPGTVASGAGAVSWGPGRIDIVARTAANTVQHWWFDANFGVWNVDNLGGNIASDPDIASWGPGRLDVFAKGAQGNLVHKYYANGAWSNWESLGGVLASGPAAVSWGSKRLDVVARATDNSIQHWYYVEP